MVAYALYVYLNFITKVLFVTNSEISAQHKWVIFSIFHLFTLDCYNNIIFFFLVNPLIGSSDFGFLVVCAS